MQYPDAVPRSSAQMQYLDMMPLVKAASADFFHGHFFKLDKDAASTEKYMMILHVLSSAARLL